MGDIVKKRLKSGRVAYYIRYLEVDGQRVKRATKARNDEEAMKLLASAEWRVSQAQVGIAKPTKEKTAQQTITVRELAKQFCGVNDDFQSGYVGDGLRDTQRYRREAWSVFQRHILDVIGDERAASVKRSDIVKLRDGMQAKRKNPRSIQRAVRTVSKLFNWAIDYELLVCDNPARRIRLPKCTSSTEFYSSDEVARLLTTAAEKMPALYPMVACAFYSGMRKGEIAALRWGDVDLDGGRVIVSRSWTYSARKSGQPVTVLIHPRLEAILRAHKPVKPEPDALVFPTASGKMRDRFKLWGLDKLVKLANVRRFKHPWHSFRHASATALATSGASLADIQQALGQSSLEMARRYTHIAAEHLRERIAALPTLGPDPNANLLKQDEALGLKKPTSPKNPTRKRARPPGTMAP